MKIAVIGLGKMGHAIAQKLHNGFFEVVGYDRNESARVDALKAGIPVVDCIDALQGVDLFWIMVPAGAVVDVVIAEIVPLCRKGTIIVDGGNSFYKDSQRRAQMVAQQGLFYFDCGTSGGIHGMTDGFCLMIGGDRVMYNKIDYIFAALSVPGGYGYVGNSGAGHYVKMVHNGIEYGLMQAYAEGLHILKEGSFKDEKLDLAAITGLWSTNAVIRSFLLQLAHEGLTQNPGLTGVSGRVAESGMGLWTDQEARLHNIPDPVLAQSLEIRAQSRQTGGNYATQILSLLRNKFGGHDYSH
jgi:6-phosphogluconate dehydrogenase